MLKNAVASKRDKGDYTPSAMLKQVIGIYGTLAKEKNAAGLHVLFLEMARILGPDATSSQEAAELYLNAIKTGRDEAVILSAQTNLRTSLAGTFELVRTALSPRTRISHPVIHLFFGMARCVTLINRHNPLDFSAAVFRVCHCSSSRHEDLD